MPINFWTATGEDLQSLEGIGPKYSEKLLLLRKSVFLRNGEVTVKDLSNVALKEEKWQQWVESGELSLNKPDNLSLHSYSSIEFADLKDQVKMLSADNDIFQQKFALVDSKLDTLTKHMVGRDEQFLQLSEQMSQILRRFDTFAENAEKREKDSMYPPSYWQSSSVSNMAPPPGFERITRVEPSKVSDYDDPCHVAGATGFSAGFGSVENTEPKSKQQQEEIDHMLAVICSCCPDDDIYNGPSMDKQKSAFNNADLKKDDPKKDTTSTDRLANNSKQKVKPNRGSISNDSTSSSSSSSSDSDSSNDKNRRKHRKARRKHRSKSPVMPKMPEFSGKEDKVSWRSFIGKFERTAERRKWSKSKKLDKLFDCLTETALEYANRSEKRHKYKDLKKDLEVRFDLRDTALAARQKLHVIRQKEEETEENFLQRVLTLAADGYSFTGNDATQQLATEAFLRGLRHKDVAIQVLNKSPKSVQQACTMVKDTLANSKAIFGSKVTFQQRLFTYEEDKRVTSIENKVDKLCNVVLGKRSSTPDPRQRSPSPYDRSRSFRGHDQNSPSRGRLPYRPRYESWEQRPDSRSPTRSPGYSSQPYRQDGYRYRRDDYQRDNPRQRSPYDKRPYDRPRSPYRSFDRPRSPDHDRRHRTPPQYGRNQQRESSPAQDLNAKGLDAPATRI